ncbi:MAG: bifunctional metallophosphatase/5'-nucleotidase [Proteobacteria bacterium]|nr:bifunctional metallophosphatase/5'-nucleotidase [Pseudomonadota bacterium]
MQAKLRVFVAALLFAAATVIGAAGALAQATKLTILHLNDVYEIAPIGNKGGFAQVMTLLKQERGKAANHITTFGGDLISPSILSGMTKGSQMIELTGALGVDIAVLGNHEFDFGPEIAKQRIAEAKYPWLGTNVLGPDGKPLGGTVATATRKVGEFTVGFFGITTPETAALSSPGPTIKFAPIEETAAAAVKTLKAQGADVIIAMTHLNLAEDRALAKNVKGIDVVMGGHDHDPMTIYENNALIFKSGYDGHYLGAVELSIERVPGRSGGAPTMRVVPTAWRLTSTIGVAADPEVAALVKAHTDRLDKELQTAVGKTDVALDSRRDAVRTEETAIGNLIADAMLDGVKADVAILSGGGIRGDKTYDAGTTLTRKDILTELPFGNGTVLIEVTGADLLAAIENGVSRIEDKQGRFPQIAGMRFTYDLKRPRGGRVISVTIGSAPLDAAKTYRVATTDYLMGGGDDYQVFKKAKIIIDPSGAKLQASMVMDYIAAKGTVSPKIEGRITAQK